MQQIWVSQRKPSVAGYSGILCNYSTSLLGCFTTKLSIQSSLYEKIMGVIHAIQGAGKKGWENLWLECDSTLVVQVICNHGLVPWQLRNRWYNCIDLTNKMNFEVCHIC